MTNKDRAEIARETIAFFGQLIQIGPTPHNELAQDLAADLIADIFHLLDEEDIAHGDVVECAMYNHGEEVLEEVSDE